MTDRENLEWLISETDFLIEHSVIPSTPGFQVWFTKAERFLIKRFGEESYEHTSFKGIKFRPGLYTDESFVVKKCRDGLTTAKHIFQAYLEEMDDEDISAVTTNTTPSFNKIFIVHGHDGELKQSVARIIEKQEIEAIILSEQVNLGRTIIEKFEDYSDVDGAICLFTADDFGRAKNDTTDNTRARQNVVLETGYFMGKLGRNRTVILADSDIEMPSDLSGVVYTNTSNWHIDLLKELKAMGYTVDFNKLF